VRYPIRKARVVPIDREGVEGQPGSLRSVAGVRAARTAEKIGHFGRDDRVGTRWKRSSQLTVFSSQFRRRETKNGRKRNCAIRSEEEHRQECLCHDMGGSGPPRKAGPTKARRAAESRRCRMQGALA